MKKFILVGLLACGLQARNLDIYWVDVEGGGSTLIVTPEGQSLLVDTGNPAPDDRDAKRIFQAAQKAGLKKIDYLMITHFHGDHVGGVPALAKLIPIEHFLDHGDSIEAQDPRSGPAWAAYKTVAAGKRTTLKPGDKLPLKGLDAEVVASNGQIISTPVNGGGAANPNCAGAVQHPADRSSKPPSLQSAARDARAESRPRCCGGCNAYRVLAFFAGADASPATALTIQPRRASRSASTAGGTTT